MEGKKDHWRDFFSLRRAQDAGCLNEVFILHQGFKQRDGSVDENSRGDFKW